MSSGPVDPERRSQVLALVSGYLGLRPGDLVRFDCTFQQSHDEAFTVRIDYAAARRGGYQILTGICNDQGVGAVLTYTPVLGRGRVTRRVPLVETTGPSREELEAERRQLDIELEFGQGLLDDERKA